MKHVTLNLNANLMPIDRGEMFEDFLDEKLDEIKYGYVDGGGALLETNGEISFCDVAIYIEKDFQEALIFM